MSATYREVVDDVMIAFRDNNEQKSDINPNHIFWKLLTLIQEQLEIYFERLPGLDVAPLWARTTTGELNAIPVTTGDITGMLDPNLKVSKFTIPSLYSRMQAINPYEGITNIYAGSGQRQMFIENKDEVMRRINAQHWSLKMFHYGYISGNLLFVYPFTPVIKMEYIPKDLWDKASRPDPDTQIPYPQLILSPAINELIKYLEEQQHRPDDSIPDFIEQNQNARN